MVGAQSERPESGGAGRVLVAQRSIECRQLRR